MIIDLLKKSDFTELDCFYNENRWNFNPNFFSLFLEYEPFGCFLAKKGEKIAGLVTTTNYSRFAWIGNVLVSEKFRNKGVGTLLTNVAIDYLNSQNVKTIRLDSSQMAKSIYRKLGFQDEQLVIRLTLGGLGIEKDSSSIAEFEEGDIKELLDFDKEIFEADRSFFLTSVIKKLPSECFLAKNNGKIVGYILARQLEDQYKIGPWICDVNYTQLACGLIDSLLVKLRKTYFLLDVPETSPIARRIIQKYFFKDNVLLQRMFMGEKYWGTHPFVHAVGSAAKG